MKISEVAGFVARHESEHPDTIYQKLISSTASNSNRDDIENMHLYNAVIRLSRLDSGLLKLL